MIRPFSLRSLLPVLLACALTLLGGACSTGAGFRIAPEALEGSNWTAAATRVQEARAGEGQEEPEKAEEESGPGAVSIGWTILMYLPNRLFDIFDVARARVRAGPGFSLSGRLTRPVSGAVGFHSAVWVGLHGPRGGRGIPWPLGVENFAGVQVSVVDQAAPGQVYYGLLEVGAGFQLLILGADVGVDVFEAFDLLAGIVTADPAEDDF